MVRPRQAYSFHVRPRGPSWVGFYRVFEGDTLRIKQKVLGARTGPARVTKTAAVDMFKKWVESNVPAYGVVKENPTLLELWKAQHKFEMARAEKGKLAKQTVVQHASMWPHLEPLADMDARDITGEMIEDLFDAMVTKGMLKADGSRVGAGEPLASKTKKHVRQLLRSLLKRTGPGGDAAVDDAQMRFETAPKGKTLTEDAIRGIIGKLPTDHDVLIFQLGLTTGIRAAELSRLTAWHVRDFGFIDMPGTKTALSKSRLPLIPQLSAPLTLLAGKAISTEQPLLFAQKTHRQWLENVLQPAAAAVGATADMLVLRRTALTRAARQDESGASKMARHTTTRMLRDVYDSAADDTILEVQRAVWAHMSPKRTE